MTERRPAWKDPQFWEDRVKADRDYRAQGIKDAIRFSAWYSGDMGTLRSQVAQLLGGSVVAPLSNHININTQAALSELFFRNPTLVSRPQPQFGPPFGEKLARLETRNLNDWVDESDFFNEGRKCILDGLLTPMMIFEVGYSADIGVDEEMIESERLHAQTEDMAMLAGGKPKVSKEDYDPAHIEQHDRTIAEIEKGVIPAPAGVLRYMKKHRKFHADKGTKDGARPLETVRHESVFGERVSYLCFSYDSGASASARRRWVGKWFLKPIHEVKANQRYNAEARRSVKAADLTALGGAAMEKALKVASDEEIEDMALMFEGVDLEQGKVVLFSQGADRMLIEAEYREKRIRPGGPYITASFITDPVTGLGVAPPRIYEGHQEMVSYCDTLIAVDAKRNVSQMAGVGNYLSQDDVDKITSGIPSAFIHLKKVPPKTDLKEVIQRIPKPESSDFLFKARLLHEHGAERYSGIGSAKSGGGDFSRTATASAIVNDSVTNLAEDRRAVMDDFMSRIARDVIRLQRRWYTLGKVVEVAGIEAADEDGWPAWSERDIVRDKGVSVVPGSSRRKDTAVDLKLNTELLAVFSKLPMVPPTVIVQLAKRALDSAGQFGMDLTEMDAAAAMMQIEQLLGGGGGGMEGGGGPPTNPERRANAKGEGTQAAVQQGNQNVGGGRVPTGAGNGDAPRMMR